MKICLKCDEVFSSNGWICSACGYEPARLNDMEVHAPEFANTGGGFKAEYFSELVGCGTGFVLSGIARTFPKLTLSGSEIFLAGLSHAAKRVPAAHFIQMDARRVPFVEEFDAIGAFDVLEHIEEDEKVLAQLYRAIKPGGVLLLTVPQHPWLWSASDEYACHVRRYTCKEIEQKVFTAGFGLLRSSSFVTSLLPAMMVSRVWQKQRTKEFDPAGELKINAALNKFFYGLMKLELTGIRAGMNFPVGGSRLIVAGRN